MGRDVGCWMLDVGCWIRDSRFEIRDSRFLKVCTGLIPAQNNVLEITQSKH